MFSSCADVRDMTISSGNRLMLALASLSRAGRVVRLLVQMVMLVCMPAPAAVILQYHHVSEDTPAATSVTPAQFADHLTRLHEAGFRVLPLDELLARLRAGVDPRERLVAITFDDGGLDLYHHALPLLEARDWTAAVFVTTGLVGTRDMLNVQQLREIRRRGHLVLNHSLDHPHMVRRAAGESEAQWLARMREQVAGAQARLGEWLGETPPRYFAWPYGEHDPTLRRMLDELGFVGLAQVSGALDADMSWQAVPRIPVNRTYADWSSLKDKVLALPLPVIETLPASGITLARRPRLHLTLAGDWRDRGLSCFAGGEPIAPSLKARGQNTSVTLHATVPEGRSRFTCTAPAGDGRHYWYSWLWMRWDGEKWYEEPRG